MARKGTKAYQGEITRIFYGINRKTLEVESVSCTRGGTLHGRNYFTHNVIPPRDPKREVSLVYSLTDIIEIPAHLHRSDDPQVKALEEKAKKLREGAADAKNASDEEKGEAENKKPRQ